MVNFGKMVLLYFVVGAVMVGGGAIQMENAGMVGEVVSADNSGYSLADEIGDNLSASGSAISEVAQLMGGVLVILLNLITLFLGYLNWPLIVLQTNNAPPSIVLLVGGSLTAAFYVSVAKFLSRAS